ncbi:hypothetical protein F0562_021632 [Nyssa sinensis]|uniref:Uncharacterized protein n=1 Tax=Nyssa sinensis TaxID=561372 RepID=A0A5J5BPH4_9ASTE|nr:hypothetical protein F0562_021632 [Nyssa sinensis]
MKEDGEVIRFMEGTRVQDILSGHPHHKPHNSTPLPSSSTLTEKAVDSVECLPVVPETWPTMEMDNEAAQHIERAKAIAQGAASRTIAELHTENMALKRTQEELLRKLESMKQLGRTFGYHWKTPG